MMLTVSFGLGTGYWVLGTGHWALGTGHWVLSTEMVLLRWTLSCPGSGEGYGTWANECGVTVSRCTHRVIMVLCGGKVGQALVESRVPREEVHWPPYPTSLNPRPSQPIPD